jgi:hypothetical protein
MSGQTNSENFMVSEALKNKIDPDNFSLSKGSASRNNRKKDMIDEVRLCHPDSPADLFFPLFSWSEDSVTIISPFPQLEKFINPVADGISFSLFDKTKTVKSTSAVKKDGEWYVTLFLRT